MQTETDKSQSERTVESYKLNSAQTHHRDAWKIAGDLPSSFRYAWQGLVYSLKTQRNFRIHLLIGTFAIGASIWLELSPNEFAIIVLTVSAVIILELINTSIEAVVDLAIGRRFHPLARIAKDCAAAGVLVASCSSLLIGFLILIPPFLNRLGN